MKINTKYMRDQVLRCVDSHPKAADDDKLLISYIWADEGWDNEKSLIENLRHVSSPETITRARRKLQEEGKIKPSEKAMEARFRNFEQARWDIY